MNSPKPAFNKPPTTLQEQITLLKSRGMLFQDLSRAERYLSHITYYRLSAYWLPFEENHSPCTFKDGTEFNTILEHYIFDREFRLLVMDAVERIEVSLRTQYTNYLSLTYGSHPHLDKNIYKQDNKSWSYDENRRELEKCANRNKGEEFIKHFDRYKEELPPLWAVCEIMTLGHLSRWYKNLKHRKDRNGIAAAYGLDEKILSSFLHHLSVIRNLCAHHMRLWNREFTLTYTLPKKHPYLDENLNNENTRKVYNTLVMLSYLMDKINPNRWKNKIIQLFCKHPNVNANHMGFPTDWKKMSIWRDTKMQIVICTGELS